MAEGGGINWIDQGVQIPVLMLNKTDAENLFSNLPL